MPVKVDLSHHPDPIRALGEMAFRHPLKGRDRGRDPAVDLRAVQDADTGVAVQRIREQRRVTVGADQYDALRPVKRGPQERRGRGDQLVVGIVEERIMLVTGYYLVQGLLPISFMPLSPARPESLSTLAIGG